jgi:hypothetical protein
MSWCLSWRSWCAAALRVQSFTATPTRSVIYTYTQTLQSTRSNCLNPRIPIDLHEATAVNTNSARTQSSELHRIKLLSSSAIYDERVWTITTSVSIKVLNAHSSAKICHIADSKCINLYLSDKNILTFEILFHYLNFISCITMNECLTPRNGRRFVCGAR